MPVNLVKHVRRLVQKQTRLTRYIDRRQKELDGVTKELQRVEAAMSAAKPRESMPAAPDAAEGRQDDWATVRSFVCAKCGGRWDSSSRPAPPCPHCGDARSAQVAAEGLPVGLFPVFERFAEVLDVGDGRKVAGGYVYRIDGVPVSEEEFNRRLAEAPTESHPDEGRLDRGC